MTFLKSILLRIRDDGRFTPVNRLLEGLEGEVDDNFIAIASYILAMDVEGQFAVWSSELPYDEGDVVIFNGALWLQVNTASPSVVTGVTPGTDATIWERIKVSRFFHRRNRDTALDEGGPDAITAEEIRERLPTSCVAGFTRYFNVNASQDTFIINDLPAGFTLSHFRLGQTVFDPVINASDFTFSIASGVGTLVIHFTTDQDCTGHISGFCG
jgi:hypothetical protein